MSKLQPTKPKLFRDLQEAYKHQNFTSATFWQVFFKSFMTIIDCSEKEFG